MLVKESPAMLTILGSADRGSTTCDRVSRRDFLTIGGMVMGGLSLPQLLSVEAQAGNRPEPQGDHQRLPARWSAASGHVGSEAGCPQSRSGASSSRSARRCPASRSARSSRKIAAIADKCIFIRSMIGATGGHDAYQCMTGRPLESGPRGRLARGGRVDQQAEGAGESERFRRT
jgi:hypothetical protein